MKKKIALLLAAALLSFGLIVSCGGGDDPTDDPSNPSNPSNPNNPAGTQYTVSFDTDGGTPATIESIKVNAGTAVGAAKWPDDPARGDEVFDGWYEGTTKYTASTKIEKDVTLKAAYSPFTWPSTAAEYVTALGAITWKNNASQQGWRANGMDDADTDLEWEEIQYAKYLVLHTIGGTDATLGEEADAPDTWKTQFNGIQVVAQSDGNGYGWAQTNLSAVEFTRAADKDVYIVIDTRALKDFNKIVGGTKGKILIAYWNCVNMFQGLGLQEAYLTNKDLTKPADAVDIVSNGPGGIGGYVTAGNILGLTAPTTTYTVKFTTDGGTPTIADIIVGEGKALGVRYPDWVKKEGFDFGGWFDGSTEVKADTVITKNVNLKAKWKDLYPWPVIPNAVKIADDGNGQWAINGKFPFKYFIIGSVGMSGSGIGGIQFGLQGSGASQKIKVTGDWTSFTWGEEDEIYFIIDVKAFSNYDDVSSDGGWAQFRVNDGLSKLGKYQGYIVDNSVELTEPDDAVNFTGTTDYPPSSGGDNPLRLDGFVTKTLPVELQ